jgi:glycosyltransferase involved in cell wall biosynthesis
VISQTIRKLVESEYGLNSDVIPNGVNSPVLTSSTGLLEKFGLISGKYVLQVSRFVPEKRQNDLVRAFLEAGLKDWRLLFVGNFDPRDAFCQEVETLAKGDDRIVFAGFRTGEQLSQLFQNAGLFVLPSSHEGLPIALLEAMSFGLRVLASDIPANLEVKLPESSFFPLGDTAELAVRSRLAAERPDSEEAAAARSRWVLEQYSWADIAERTVRVYQDALGPSSGHVR